MRRKPTPRAQVERLRQDRADRLQKLARAVMRRSGVAAAERAARAATTALLHADLAGRTRRKPKAAAPDLFKGE